MPVLSSCTMEPDEPFRVGTNVWPGYETLYLARSLGYYEGSNIRLVELPNASEVIQALRNGTLEAAALTLDEALTIVQDGYDLRVVLIMDFSRGGDVLLAGSGIERLSELRGKRIGVENTAVGAIILDAALQQAGLVVQDVEIMPLMLDEHEKAFKSGQVDALVTFEPVSTHLVAGGAGVLFDSTSIPDRIIDVLVVQADVADKKGGALRQLIRGHFLALDYMDREPEDASRRIAPRLGLNEMEIINAYAGLHMPDMAENRRLLGGTHLSLLDSTQQLAKMMLERGMLQRSPQIESLFSDSWLQDK